MSVIKSKRGKSPVQFVEDAYTIEKETLRIVIKHIPKRYTFFLSQKMVGCAVDACVNVKQGNSVYVTTGKDALLRREFFMRAYTLYQALITQIDLAHELFHFPDNQLTGWLGLIDEEMKNLKAIMKSDQARFENAGLLEA